MDQEMVEIGERIRSRIPSSLSQRRLAGLVDMTPDALSRALNGQRGFSSIELANLGDTLGADVYWLITGRQDPLRVDIAARHAWDPLRAQRVNPGREADDEILQSIVAAYRQAYPDGPPASGSVPEDPEEVRTLLGADFVRGFAEEIESALGIDVIRVPGLSTDYSLTIGERGVVLLVSTSNWFRNNWSAAHELAHLALGHHAGGSVEQANEEPADGFAAALLLPGDLMRSIDWKSVDESGLADFIWRTGVSTGVLRHRLRNLRIRVPAMLSSALDQPTQRLLRAHVHVLIDATTPTDPIMRREAESTGRRFPLRLLSDLARRVETGQADPAALAWLLDVPIDDIDFPEPDEDLAVERYEQVLAGAPSAADWKLMLAADDADAAGR
jgi:transcriptional regulator with XRE-family HTH domain